MSLLSQGVRIDVALGTFPAGYASLGVAYGTVAHGLGVAPDLVEPQLVSFAANTQAPVSVFGVGGNASVATFGILASTLNPAQQGPGGINVKVWRVHSIAR